MYFRYSHSPEESFYVPHTLPYHIWGNVNGLCQIWNMIWEMNLIAYVHGTYTRERVHSTHCFEMAKKC